MELSDLAVFDGRLLAADDRTGMIYEIKDDKVGSSLLSPIFSFYMCQKKGKKVYVFLHEVCVYPSSFIALTTESNRQISSRECFSNAFFKN